MDKGFRIKFNEAWGYTCGYHYNTRIRCRDAVRLEGWACGAPGARIERNQAAGSGCPCIAVLIVAASVRQQLVELGRVFAMDDVLQSLRSFKFFETQHRWTPALVL